MKDLFTRLLAHFSTATTADAVCLPCTYYGADGSASLREQHNGDTGWIAQYRDQEIDRLS